MPLYHVQDDDRPVYIFAESYPKAYKKWVELIKLENPDCDEEDFDSDFFEPKGITFICSDYEFLK